MNSLQKFITDNLDFLYSEYGLKTTNSQYESEEGNALIELQNDSLLIQCIKDRGVIELYFANNNSPKELFELSELIEINTGEKPAYQSSDRLAIHFLKENFNIINELLVKTLPTALNKRNVIREKELRSLGYQKKA